MCRELRSGKKYRRNGSEVGLEWFFSFAILAELRTVASRGLPFRLSRHLILQIARELARRIGVHCFSVRPDKFTLDAFSISFFQLRSFYP